MRKSTYRKSCSGSPSSLLDPIPVLLKALWGSQNGLQAHPGKSCMFGAWISHFMHESITLNQTPQSQDMWAPTEAQTFSYYLALLIRQKTLNHRIIESQNGLGWKGPRSLSSSNPAAVGRVATHWIRLLRNSSCLIFSASRNGAPTALGSSACASLPSE